MAKRKIFKKMGAMAVGVLLLGTTAFAAERSYGPYTLNTSQDVYTSTSMKETGNNYGYISRTKPDPTSTTIGANFTNSNHITKSASVQIKGVGHKNASYSGYNVDNGDYLAFHIWNPTTLNGGAQITAAGKYEL